MRLRAGIPRVAAAGAVPFLVTFAAFTALMASANLPTTLYAFMTAIVLGAFREPDEINRES